MKTIVRSFLAISMAAAIVGCVKEETERVDNSQLRDVVFHAGWAPETKTVLQEDGRVWWSPGDEISLFVGSGDNGGYKLTSTNTEPAAAVDFVGQIGSAPENATYTAIYPYDSANWFDGTELFFTIPNEQIAKEGTFEKGMFISIAQSVDDNLYFRNVCGGIKFSVRTPGIKRVEISSRNYCAHLAGSFVSNAETGEIRKWGGLSTSITVSAPLESGFEVGKNYYAIIIPCVCDSGVDIKYYTNDRLATFEYNKSIEFKRGVFKRLIDKDQDLVFTKWHSSIARLFNILPDGVDKREITQAFFHTLSDKETDVVLTSSGAPVYFEMDGTVVHYYTSAEVYSYETLYPFLNWRKLQELDLSSWDISRITNLDWWFFGCEALRTLDISSFEAASAVSANSMFSNCFSLETIRFGNFGGKNIESMSSMFSMCRSLETIDLSSFNTQNLKDMSNMFSFCGALKNLDLSTFNATKLESLEYAFHNCISLESIDLSSFYSTNLTNASNLFVNCTRLRKLDFGDFDLSQADNLDNFMDELAKVSKRCVVRCCENTKTTILSNESPYFNKDYIVWVDSSEPMPEVPVYRDPDLYYSTDYSMHNKSKMLKTANVGKGIDIVIMGEAYSDRLIADGTYESDMQLAIDALFDTEPFKTYEDYFNVYMVYLVSANEMIDADTALQGGVWYGPYITCWGELQIPVALKVTGNPDLSETTIITIINDERIGGVASWATGGYDVGANEDERLSWSIMYIGRGDRNYESAFKGTVAHEFGHGFAFLADEYVTRDESISEDEAAGLLPHGLLISDQFYPNIDITSDPSQIKWSIFLGDERYANTGLGVYEGGFTYARGVWRPTLDSIMNGAQLESGFNVPSRQAIYKRIHKIAYGTAWEYNHEAFVQQDLKNVQQSAPTSVRSVPDPVLVDRKPFFKIEESFTKDGKKIITITQN